MTIAELLNGSFGGSIARSPIDPTLFTPHWTLTLLASASASVGVAIILGAAVFVVGTLVILLFLSRSVRRIRDGSLRYARGDLSQRITTDGLLPLSPLVDAVNGMAQQLNQRLETVIAQRNEVEAVLASMVEGVLGVDLEERVINVNAAAARMLDTDPSRALGRSIQEVVRSTAVQNFVADALASTAPLQRELSLRVATQETGESEPVYLQAHGADLLDAQGRKFGTLVVLHDVTKLHQLEAIRRDFVANVSHEIRTPVTAIKGSIETVLDLAQTQPLNEDVRRFLEIAARQADRLNVLIEDLLTLARVEREETAPALPLLPSDVGAVVETAAEACQVVAQARRTTIEISCPRGLIAPLNADLFERAVVNLLDNAVKYSPEGSTVWLETRREAGEIIVAVRDRGAGIEPEHLPRVFERFYRTDKARSRAMGGTGLGLAIVKHVAQVHRGRVSVDSTPGMGSTFRIHLPAADRPHNRPSPP